MSKTAYYKFEQPAVIKRARDARNALLDLRTRQLHRKRGKWRLIIQVDGTWSHKRNAYEATVLCFDADTNELIELQHLVKARKGELYTHEDKEDRRLLHYRGPSKGMEGDGVAAIMKRLKDSGLEVAAVVKDDDSTAMNAVRQQFPHAQVCGPIAPRAPT